MKHLPYCPIRFFKLAQHRQGSGVDGVDANLEQLKRGMAWHYKAYQREQSLDDRLAYAAAEKESAASRIGLWQDTEPVAPWAFRHPAKAAP